VDSAVWAGATGRGSSAADTPGLPAGSAVEWPAGASLRSVTDGFSTATSVTDGVFASDRSGAIDGPIDAGGVCGAATACAAVVSSAGISGELAFSSFGGTGTIGTAGS
jgi:hypothetical protein